MSVGSFNFPAVRHAFQSAYMTLTCMIGAAYERNRDQSKNEKNSVSTTSRTMITLLGSILTLDRKVLEQRDFIQSLYEKFKDGELIEDSFGLRNMQSPPKVKENHKRKRDDSDSDDVLYIEESSDDFLESSEEEGMISDDGDITSFYRIGRGKKA